MVITVDKIAKKRVPYKPSLWPTFLAKKYTSKELKYASKSLKRKEKIRERSTDSKGKKYLNCHGFGHFQAQCPDQRALTLKEIEDLQGEIETIDEQHVFDESNEEETVGADYGEILVVRRAMHMAEAPKEKTQRENCLEMLIS
ncbi:zf-CCHC domain-containing protein [Tanacetum coccineum]